MPKERLDLMVDSAIKLMLKNVASREGVSMSQLVEMMLMEHLSEEPAPEDPIYAVTDMLWLQKLQREFTEAVKAGTLYSFDTYCDLSAQDLLPDSTAPIVLYVGKETTMYDKWEFVLDYLVDEFHDDIISTYDRVLHTISVRLGWAEGDDGSLEPFDIRIWPKGKVDENNSFFDWDCGVEWQGIQTRNNMKGVTQSD